MGETAENVALHTGISREDQDRWGVRSQNRAEEAIASGFFEREIAPVTLPDGTVVRTDVGPRAGTSYEKISQLNPVFRPNGTVTAGNACPLNDGAAAVIVMSDTRAKELGLTPLARVVSTGVSGLSPEIMGLGPIEAVKKALGYAKMAQEMAPDQSFGAELALRWRRASWRILRRRRNPSRSRSMLRSTRTRTSSSSRNSSVPTGRGGRKSWQALPIHACVSSGGGWWRSIAQHS
jgi:hypothetical protein